MDGLADFLLSTPEHFMHFLILKEHIIAQIHGRQLMLLHSEEVMTLLTKNINLVQCTLRDLSEMYCVKRVATY